MADALTAADLDPDALGDPLGDNNVAGATGTGYYLKIGDAVAFTDGSTWFSAKVDSVTGGIDGATCSNDGTDVSNAVLFALAEIIGKVGSWDGNLVPNAKTEAASEATTWYYTDGTDLFVTVGGKCYTQTVDLTATATDASASVILDMVAAHSASAFGAGVVVSDGTTTSNVVIVQDNSGAVAIGTSGAGAILNGVELSVSSTDLAGSGKFFTQGVNSLQKVSVNAVDYVAIKVDTVSLIAENTGGVLGTAILGSAAVTPVEKAVAVIAEEATDLTAAVAAPGGGWIKYVTGGIILIKKGSDTWIGSIDINGVITLLATGTEFQAEYQDLAATHPLNAPITDLALENGGVWALEANVLIVQYKNKFYQTEWEDPGSGKVLKQSATVTELEVPNGGLMEKLMYVLKASVDNGKFDPPCKDATAGVFGAYKVEGDDVTLQWVSKHQMTLTGTLTTGTGALPFALGTGTRTDGTIVSPLTCGVLPPVDNGDSSSSEDSSSEGGGGGQEPDSTDGGDTTGGEEDVSTDEDISTDEEPSEAPGSETTDEAPPPEEKTSSSGGGGSGNTAGIIGGVVGGVVAVALIAGLLYFFVFKKKKDPVEGEEQEAPAGDAAAPAAPESE